MLEKDDFKHELCLKFALLELAQKQDKKIRNYFLYQCRICPLTGVFMKHLSVNDKKRPNSEVEITRSKDV